VESGKNNLGEEKGIIGKKEKGKAKGLMKGATGRRKG